MAKEKKESPSWKDFQAEDNLLNNFEEEVVVDEQEEEQEEEEQEEEVKPEPKKKEKVKKEKAKVETEEEETEEEEEVKPEPKKKEKKTEPKAEVETEEEGEEKDKEAEEEAEEPEDSAAFFEEVEKLTGVEVEVDYGKVDPLTPQGIALREKALQEKIRDTFIEELEENYPQVYKALVHANNGGDVASLFTQTTGRDYSRVEIKDGDDSLAKEILKEYYKSKGIKSDARIATLLESAEEGESGLVSEARSVLDELKEEQEEQKTNIIKEQEKVAQEQKRRDAVFVASIDEVLNSRNLGSFKITDKADAAEFRKFVLSRVTRGNDGKYNIVTQADPSKLEKILQAQFFQYKGGDLGKIVQQQASTVNAQKLKLRMKGEQNKTKKGTEESNGGLSMNDFRTAG